MTQTIPQSIPREAMTDAVKLLGLVPSDLYSITLNQSECVCIVFDRDPDGHRVLDDHPEVQYRKHMVRIPIEADEVTE